MLDLFWSAHDPTAANNVRQYRNAIFYTGASQKEAALASRGEVRTRLHREVETDVEPLGAFYPAEAYHQKYLLRSYERLFNDLLGLYGSEKALLESTVAARLNGHLGTYVGRSELLVELDKLALSPGKRTQLQDIITRTLPR